MKQISKVLCWSAIALSVISARAADGAVDAAVWVPRLSLPPVLSTRELVSSLPQVQAAMAGRDLASARADGLRSGAYEWALRAGAQQRSETSGTRYMENEVALERSIRWGGKAETDRTLGAAGMEAAQAGYADQWHEAVRSLLQGWYEWRRAHSSARVQAQQVLLAQEQLDVASRRVRAGDVPRIDELMAQAERDRVVALQQQALGHEAELRADLGKRYPGLVLPRDEETLVMRPEDLTLPGDAPQWVRKILDDNHEIELAEAELRVARLRSERAGQDRRPDPLLGVRAARERDGAENIVGVYVGIPLTGSYRESEQRAALAEMAAAEQRLQQIRQRVEAAAERVVLRASHTLATWQRLAAVAESMERVAQLGMKAYSLGEMTLTEALQTRRTALEAALAAESARWEACEAISRVLVDAHLLWAADEGRH